MHAHFGSKLNTRLTVEATRSFAPFKVVSEYQPSGDQPTAIADLAQRINAGETDVVLLGATGTGKSATTADRKSVV